ncbi:MAG: hypothetical protein MHMPM18_003797, partial [Marteilia pararefringens]
RYSHHYHKMIIDVSKLLDRPLSSSLIEINEKIRNFQCLFKSNSPLCSDSCPNNLLESNLSNVGAFKSFRHHCQEIFLPLSR